MITYPTKRPWGIDVSEWNDLSLNYKELVNRGATFAFVKASMGGGISTSAQQFVSKLRDVGFKYVGIYHWSDPIYLTPDSQLSHIDKAVQTLKPDAIAVDNEQWWASWQAYYKYLRKEISVSEVPKLNPQHISDFGYKLTKKVQETFRLPTLNYTANWFIEKWSPQMRKWINEFDLWFAYYPFGSQRWTSWEQFYNIVSYAPPTIPKGATKWTFWQITDRKYLPNFPARFLDLNIFNGSHADLDVWFKPADEPEPQPEPEPYFETYQNKRAWLGMIVRDAPVNGKDTGERIPIFGEKSKFKVYEKLYHPPHWWGRIDPKQSKWVALSWSERID